MEYNEIRKRFENIDYYFRAGELYKELTWLDENAPDLTNSQQKELKAILASKREFILCFDENMMKRIRKAEKISRKRFWWWMDKI